MHAADTSAAFKHASLSVVCQHTGLHAGTRHAGTHTYRRYEPYSKAAEEATNGGLGQLPDPPQNH